MSINKNLVEQHYALSDFTPTHVGWFTMGTAEGVSNKKGTHMLIGTMKQQQAVQLMAMMLCNE